MRWGREVGFVCVAVVLGLAGGFLGQSFAKGEEGVLGSMKGSNESAAEEGEVLVGAGDIAACDNTGDEATAELLDGIPGTVFTTGDNVYESGELGEFTSCYGPSWGRHKDRTRPAIGNHDYGAEGYEEMPGDPRGYFTYFGDAAGVPGEGWYSYDLGEGQGRWHVVVLNSNCDEVGCEEGSLQLEWLEEDLAASEAECTLAYWHHPHFSSGPHNDHLNAMGPAWEALYEHGAEVAVGGHDHLYERFAPQDAEGNADPDRGIRQFVVGTGGKSLYPFGVYEPNSELRSSEAYGVMKFTLLPGEYEWEFVGIEGSDFTDSGGGACH